jgi:hypothetical protein
MTNPCPRCGQERPRPAKCGWITRRTKTPCEKPPLLGKHRCMFHGAAEGIGRPVIHGRHSHLRKTFGEVFEQAITDPDLLKFHADIALALVRERELADRIAAGDTAEWRQSALNYFRSLQQAMKDADPDGMRAAMTNLGSHLREGAERDQAWDMLQANVRERADLTERMVKCETAMEKVVTAKQLVVLIGQVMDVVRSRIGANEASLVFGDIREIALGRLRPDITIPALPSGEGDFREDEGSFPVSG